MKQPTTMQSVITVGVSIYPYTLLSEGAKERAYQNWSGRENYPWHEENRKVITALEDEGVLLDDWHYSDHDHYYKLREANESTYYNRNINRYDEMREYSEVTGLRATKIAMTLYYRLTSTDRAYVQKQGKRLWYRGFKPAQWVAGKPTTETLKWRRSKLEESNPCFTGYIASDVFAGALWDSIRARGVCKHNTLEDFITDALDELFKYFEEDLDGSTSQEYFAEHVAPDYYYYEDGREYDDRESVESMFKEEEAEW